MSISVPVVSVSYCKFLPRAGDIDAQIPALELRLQDYWGVDEDTVVFVADPNTGNILNFNVGSNVDLLVPRVSSNRVRRLGCLCVNLTYHFAVLNQTIL